MASDRRRGLLPAIALALVALASPAPAPAQPPSPEGAANGPRPRAPSEPSAADKETARMLMDKGDERMAAKDYAAAAQAYLGADELMHLPMTAVAVARAKAAGGLLLEARDLAIQIARSTPQADETPYYARARAEATELSRKLAARIPSLQVMLDRTPAGVAVAVDGVTLPATTAGQPRKVNPGAHVITVSAPGFATSRVEVVVSEGALLPVPITLEAAPPPLAQPKGAPLDPGGVSPLVVAGFAAGGASLVAAAITGALSLSQTATLKQVCSSNGDCGTGHDHDLAVANTLANVSNATLAIGVAGVGVGVVAVILSRSRGRRPAPAARVEPLIGPGAVGLRGRF